MLETMLSYLQYPFMQRALIVGALVSLCAALLGVSLVLKRYSMIGDGLSHVGFCALSVAAAANLAPLVVAIPVVMVAAFVLLRLNERTRVKGDAAIAMFSTTAVAVGAIVISMTRGMGEVSDYLFGKILSLTDSDVAISSPCAWRCWLSSSSFTTACSPLPSTNPSPAPRARAWARSTRSLPCSRR